MSHRHIVRPGQRVCLADIDPDETGGYSTKAGALAALEKDKRRLAELQGRLYAESRRSVLVVLQGMDTSGKDGTIKHVIGAVSPVGCQVAAFVAPSAEERDHDFIWRVYQRLPRKGNIGVFNRSHYEDVLAARVKRLDPPRVWRARYRQINEFEALISDLGTTVLKFFLHISRDEQRKRLEERLRDPLKNWKYQPSDLSDRRLWDEYQQAYEDALTRCSTAAAPWHLVPANRKWYRNLVVARTVADALERMAPKIPRIAIDPSKITVPA